MKQKRLEQKEDKLSKAKQNKVGAKAKLYYIIYFILYFVVIEK